MRPLFGQRRGVFTNAFKIGTGGISHTINLKSSQKFAVSIGPSTFIRRFYGYRPLRTCTMRTGALRGFHGQTGDATLEVSSDQGCMISH